MDRSLFRPVAGALLGVSCVASLAQAQSVELDQQVITATRTALAPTHTTASTSVITREDIERSQATTVLDTLRGLAGVGIVTNGGRGKSSTVQLRGTSDKHLLVLVDGVKVGSATDGTAALHAIPLEQIERIEVVRGPRSSLYGSEAMGGVIQIFTRKGSGDGVKPYFSVGAGSRSSYSGTAGVSGGNGAAWYSLGIASESTDGINVRAYRPSAPRSYEPDADGYRELSASLRGGYRFNDRFELDANWLRSKGHSDLDSRATNGNSGRDAYKDGELEVVGARARFSPLEPWQVSLQVAHSEDLSDQYQDGRFYSRFDSQRDSLSWQNDISLGEAQLLTVGFDYQRDRIDTTAAYARDSRNNKGAFVQYLASFGRHGLEAALRRDKDQFFGSHDTGSLGWNYELSDEVTVSAAYGTAFRAPTFNDLYYPASASTAGNPDVQPEESESFEIGLKGNQAWGEWSLNAFETRIDDLIVWSGSGSSPMRPDNVDVARIRGLESVLRTDFQGWDIVSSLTFLDPQDRSDKNHGHLLARRAKRTFNLDVDRSFGTVAVGATLYASSYRFDQAANTDAQRLPGYALVDLRGEYRFDPDWRLQVRLSNLFDREYETAQTYEQPGRAVYFTLRYQVL
ncbi:TonB-dependent vitamin B12 receptor [Pseudomonas sp. ABC1]|uniref:TonB-dependent vitamin B12 receptor n=1 Tax=Pseudomonas sp. ABC1 TaxID=2748080 RepID=UPI0015C2F060|nr:TonB-dependent vitamin B12 receptor [Pseudomonas sp. ABC1]QLF92719.1 TonB-dependent vitamin B12 receptor [Pseudomonas sp. ABC1]